MGNPWKPVKIERSTRHQHDFSILAVDLDKFKLINDDHGHITGDHVLIHLAQILRKGLRKGDILARIGGDEFSIILAETTAEQAVIVAEALRVTVKAYDFSVVLRVNLTGNKAPPILYKPELSVGMGLYHDSTFSEGYTVEMPQEMLPDFVSNISVGTNVEIEAYKRIRGVKKFSDLNDLKERISKDVEFVKNWYNSSRK